MQDEIGDLVVFIFCLLRNWALNSSTYTLLSLTNKKVSNYPLTFNGLYRAYKYDLAFCHFTHPILLQGSFFVQNLFPIIHG